MLHVAVDVGALDALCRHDFVLQGLKLRRRRCLRLVGVFGLVALEAVHLRVDLLPMMASPRELSLRRERLRATNGS